MKKLSILFAALLCTVLLPITAQAKNKTVTIDSFEASVSEARFSGTSDAAAIMVQVRDENGRILALSTFPVLDGAFDGSIEALSLTEGNTVKLYAADYEGGSFAKAQTTVGNEEDEEQGGRISEFVVLLYQQILGRDADSAGLEYWSSRLADHRQDGTNTIWGFLNSPEFTSKEALTDEQYVTLLYRAILGREPDAAGLADWTGLLGKGASRAEIVTGFVNSVEFAKRATDFGILPGEMKQDGTPYPSGSRYLVDRFYAGALGREGDEAGINQWVVSLNKKGQPIRTVLFGFLNSPEFAAKEYSYPNYIRALYRTILGRDAADSEVTDWEKKCLDKEKLVDQILGSPEFNKTLQELGLVL
ncbi:MAG: DUF4214 domain-containing protein [Lachnospiraceae bacterium]|nr:DUF4214 domain-containing protein [Lachnospiraceae bacterium]